MDSIIKSGQKDTEAMESTEVNGDSLTYRIRIDLK